MSTLEQYWEILRHYFENHGNVEECVRKLRTDVRHRHRVRYLGKKVKVFLNKNQSVKSQKQCIHPTQENIAAVTEIVRKASSTSNHRHSQQLNISETSLR